MFFLAASANTATYYVDQNHPQASDENPGTEELPWKTLKKACNTVQAGDTVIVKAGRYSDPDSTWEYAFNPVNSGEPSKPIIFKSEPRGAAVLVRHYPGGAAMRLYNRSYIIIDGFKAEGTLGFGYHCSYCELRNCEVIKGSIEGSDTSLHWGIIVHHLSHHCALWHFIVMIVSFRII